MNSIYKGIWDFGETGFTGSSWMKDRSIRESKSIFSIPEWSPIWKYKSFGFRHHVKNDETAYNLRQLRLLMRYFKIKVRYYAGDGSDAEEHYLEKAEDIKNVKFEDRATILSAENQKGQYIGDLLWAKILMDKGIWEPEVVEDSENVCSIGYSVFDHKWFGWSHRAMHGFSIGSEVKRGDCAYTPTDKDDFLEDMINFWDDSDHLNTTGKHDRDEVMESVSINLGDPEQKSVPTGEFMDGVRIEWTYSDKILNEKLRGDISGVFHTYPDSYGNGEWTAETMEDAKQMAKDFSSGVS